MQQVYPKIEFISYQTKNKDIFRLLESITFDWDIPFTVPEGFLSDGASIPRLLWILISPKIDPRTLAAAIGHDYLYRNATSSWQRAQADKFFFDCTIAHGLETWRALLAYIGLRLFGWQYWRKK